MSGLEIRDGLGAYPMPELRQPTKSGYLRAPTLEEANWKLDTILASIQNQGGRLVAVLAIDIGLPLKPGQSGYPTETQQFLIIEK